jgi:group I intron endonuclease
MGQEMIGLYAIVHAPTNRAYVGSSINIKRRIKEHMTDLRAKKHHCTYLQHAWNKYGAEQFVVKTPTILNGMEAAREVEQAFLDCFFDQLFNTNPAAVGGAWGDYSPAKRPDWHMKTVMQRMTPEERKALWGKAKGTKRNGTPYVAGAAKRLSDPEYRAKLSAACKGKRQVLKCPHCAVEGGGGNMRRYHFDKCKAKP